MISYSQNLEDVVLNRLFQGKKSGFYIDVGASDPVEMSVTKYFYDLGWSGINIEPTHAGYTKFQKMRPRDVNLNLAIGSRHDFLEIYEIEGHPEYSSLDFKIAKSAAAHTNSSINPVKVEVQTLAAICEAYCQGFIDFLKIDVEGMEKEVIEGADWKRFRPTMLVIEATEPCSGYDPADPNKNAAWQEWEPLVLDVDYILVYNDTLNRYYLRKEDGYLQNRFAFPVNPVRDSYAPYAQVREAVARKKAGKKSLDEKKELEARITQQEGASRSLEKNLEDAERECSSLQRKIENRDEKIRELELKVKQMKRSETALEGSLAATKEQLESGHFENIRLAEDRDFLKEAFAEKERELKDHHLKIEELNREMALLRHVLREKQFREDHRISCFLGRFIPFFPLPAFSARGPKASSLAAPAKSIAGSGKKERTANSVQTGGGEIQPEAVPDQRSKPVAKTRGKTLGPGLSFTKTEDFSSFGLTARHWRAAMKELEQDRNEEGVFFTPSVSATLVAGPITRPWIGIIQEPHTIPEWLYRLPGCSGAPQLFYQQSWNESLPHCRGLFAMSEYSGKFLRKRLPGKQISVLVHPADIGGEQWSMDKFLDNPERKVIQPGWYLRNLHSIYEMPKTKIERLAVPFHPDKEAFQQIFEAEHRERKNRGLLFESMMENAEIWENVSENKLGQLLTESIAFVNLYESNAVDAIIECLARATPLLVNPMPAVVEYLGPEYPFYMWCYDQAAEKVEDKTLIFETHLYLRELGMRKRMEPAALRDSILESEAYKAASGKAGL